jgi:hypothetical protein
MLAGRCECERVMGACECVCYDDRGRFRASVLWSVLHVNVSGCGVTSDCKQRHVKAREMVVNRHVPIEGRYTRKWYTAQDTLFHVSQGKVVGIVVLHVLAHPQDDGAAKQSVRVWNSTASLGLDRTRQQHTST